VSLALNEITVAKLTLVTAAYKSTNCLNTSHFQHVEQSSVQEHSRMKFRGPGGTGTGFCPVRHCSADGLHSLQYSILVCHCH